MPSLFLTNIVRKWCFPSKDKKKNMFYNLSPWSRCKELASIFYCIDGGNRFLWSICNHLPTEEHDNTEYCSFNIHWYKNLKSHKICSFTCWIFLNCQEDMLYSFRCKLEEQLVQIQIWKHIKWLLKQSIALVRQCLHYWLDNRTVNTHINWDLLIYHL